MASAFAAACVAGAEVSGASGASAATEASGFVSVITFSSIRKNARGCAGYQRSGGKNQAPLSRTSPASGCPAGSSPANDLAHDLGDVSHHGDLARIIEPGGADNPDDPDDSPGSVAIGRNNGG